MSGARSLGIVPDVLDKWYQNNSAHPGTIILPVSVFKYRDDLLNSATTKIPGQPGTTSKQPEQCPCLAKLLGQFTA